MRIIFKDWKTAFFTDLDFNVAFLNCLGILLFVLEVYGFQQIKRQPIFGLKCQGPSNRITSHFFCKIKQISFCLECAAHNVH